MGTWLELPMKDISLERHVTVHPLADPESQQELNDFLPRTWQILFHHTRPSWGGGNSYLWLRAANVLCSMASHKFLTWLIPNDHQITYLAVSQITNNRQEVSQIMTKIVVNDHQPPQIFMKNILSPFTNMSPKMTFLSRCKDPEEKQIWNGGDEFSSSLCRKNPKD